MLDERVEATIQHAAEHCGINAVVDFCFSQLHIDRNGELVTYDLTRFMAHGATIEVDANPLAVQEVHLCLCRNANATMCPERRQPQLVRFDIFAHGRVWPSDVVDFTLE